MLCPSSHRAPRLLLLQGQPAPAATTRRPHPLSSPPAWHQPCCPFPRHVPSNALAAAAAWCCRCPAQHPLRPGSSLGRGYQQPLQGDRPTLSPPSSRPRASPLQSPLGPSSRMTGSCTSRDASPLGRPQPRGVPAAQQEPRVPPRPSRLPAQHCWWVPRSLSRLFLRVELPARHGRIRCFALTPPTLPRTAPAEPRTSGALLPRHLKHPRAAMHLSPNQEWLQPLLGLQPPTHSPQCTPLQRCRWHRERLGTGVPRARVRARPHAQLQLRSYSQSRCRPGGLGRRGAPAAPPALPGRRGSAASHGLACLFV